MSPGMLQGGGADAALGSVEAGGVAAGDAALGSVEAAVDDAGADALEPVQYALPCWAARWQHCKFCSIASS